MSLPTIQRLQIQLQIPVPSFLPLLEIQLVLQSVRVLALGLELGNILELELVRALLELELVVLALELLKY